jgi:membrane fusion protein
MSSPLFRKEALDNQQDKLWGEVLVLQPVSYYLLTGLVAVFLVCLITYLIFGTYTRKEKVPGYIVPDRGIVRVFAPREGVYSEIHVAQGQEVQQGDILFSVVDEKATSDGRDVNALISQELKSERERLKQRLVSEEERRGSEEQRLTLRIQGLEEEIERLQSQRATQANRLQIAAETYQRLQELAEDGLIAESRARESYEQYLTVRQQLNEFLRQIIARRNELRESRFELEQLPLHSAERVAELKARLSELNRSSTEFDGRSAYVVRSPTNGRVAVLQAEPGQSVIPNVPAINLLPEDSVLEAQLFVPSRAIGFIERGQSVRLQYQAFPYQRFGMYAGSVATITEAILTPGEAPVPLDLREPFYRVSVSLDSQHVSAFGKQLPLQAGMLLEADVIIDERPLLQWVLEPLYSLKGSL